MRKYGLLLVALALMLMLGCGDDECPTCPSSPLKVVASGFVSVDVSDDNMYCMTLFYGADGGSADMDSMTVGGELAEMYDMVGEFGMATAYAAYEEDPTTYDSGDTLEIVYYHPSGTGTARVVLLDDDYDEPTILSHATTYPYDTVAIDEAVTISWHSVTLADYYMVYWTYRYDSSGTDVRRTEHYITGSATSMVIPAGTLSFDGRIDFSVMAVSGPRPDTEAGNISGGVINGNIASVANDYCDIYVGTGSYTSVVPPDPETPEEIVKSLMETIKH